MRNPSLTASPKQRQRRNTSDTRNLMVTPPVFRLPSLTAADDWNARVYGGTVPNLKLTSTPASSSSDHHPLYARKEAPFIIINLRCFPYNFVKRSNHTTHTPTSENHSTRFRRPRPRRRRRRYCIETLHGRLGIRSSPKR